MILQASKQHYSGRELKIVFKTADLKCLWDKVTVLLLDKVFQCLIAAQIKHSLFASLLTLTFFNLFDLKPRIARPLSLVMLKKLVDGTLARLCNSLCSRHTFRSNNREANGKMP